MAFPMAVVDAVAEAAGGKIGVGYRLSPDEEETPGLRMADTLALIDALCNRPLAYIHLSTQDRRHMSPLGEYDEAALSLVAKHLGDRLPLIGVGGVKTVEDAKEVLAMGADLVAIGRASITEPEWPLNARVGKPLRLKFPREGAADLLTLPRPLAEKMLNVPGWADVE